MTNTKKRGEITIVTFRTPRSKKWIGFCYELGIVLEGDDPKTVSDEVLEASKGYVESVAANKLPDYLLAQPEVLPEEYRKMYEFLRNKINKGKDTKAPSEAFAKAVDDGLAQLTPATV